ncbi:TPA: hypothetical protein ACJHE1_004422, partial [Yersinia enterocolitica]
AVAGLVSVLPRWIAINELVATHAASIIFLTFDFTDFTVLTGVGETTCFGTGLFDLSPVRSRCFILISHR